MAGHALDLGVVDAIGGKLVVRADELEYGRAPENQIRLVGGERRTQPQHPCKQEQNQRQPLLVIRAYGLRCHEVLRRRASTYVVRGSPAVTDGEAFLLRSGRKTRGSRPCAGERVSRLRQPNMRLGFEDGMRA